MVETGNRADALIIVDCQNDFCTGGSLQVIDSDEIFPIINCLRNLPQFEGRVFLTRDWHPENHVSFHANNPDTKLFQSVKLPDMAVA